MNRQVAPDGKADTSESYGGILGQVDDDFMKAQSNSNFVGVLCWKAAIMSQYGSVVKISRQYYDGTNIQNGKVWSTVVEAHRPLNRMKADTTSCPRPQCTVLRLPYINNDSGASGRRQSTSQKPYVSRTTSQSQQKTVVTSQRGELSVP